MSLGDDQIAFALELFEGLGDVRGRKMFGGLGLYAGDTIFAILMSDGTLRLKAAGAFRDRVQADGWEPWVYERKDGAASSMPYWRLPDAALEDPDMACDLARDALACL